MPFLIGNRGGKLAKHWWSKYLRVCSFIDCIVTPRNTCSVSVSGLALGMQGWRMGDVVITNLWAARTLKMHFFGPLHFLKCNLFANI